MRAVPTSDDDVLSRDVNQFPGGGRTCQLLTWRSRKGNVGECETRNGSLALGLQATRW